MYPQKNTYVKMIVYLDKFKKYDLVYEQNKIQGVVCGHLFSSPKVLLDRLQLRPAWTSYDQVRLGTTKFKPHE